MIKLSGLYKSYQHHIALNGIDLTVMPGEILGIIGKSGAGKSTLLRCMNLLERPDAGEIWIDEDNLMQLNAKALRQARHKTAMIFQHFNLLNSKSVYENIALPMRIQGLPANTIETKVNELLALIELTDKKNSRPNDLSGGQKQRVAIARALSTSPQLLLCDEATSALDPETTLSILGLLKKINADYQITIVLITHEMNVIKHIAHRVAVMEEGKILEINPLRALFSKKRSIARRMLYADLSPELPQCLTQRLTKTPNHTPILRLYFEGEHATGPFISQVSRLYDLDITILLANIDRVDHVTCGVLVVELQADHTLLQHFKDHCKTVGLTVEDLGYVTNNVF